jgi:hypothetical protein
VLMPVPAACGFCSAAVAAVVVAGVVFDEMAVADSDGLAAGIVAFKLAMVEAGVVLVTVGVSDVGVLAAVHVAAMAAMVVAGVVFDEMAVADSDGLAAAVGLCRQLPSVDAGPGGGWADGLVGGVGALGGGIVPLICMVLVRLEVVAPATVITASWSGGLGRGLAAGGSSPSSLLPVS